MKYNFLRMFSVFIIVFLVISIKAQDSLTLNSVSALTDSGTVKSDTVINNIVNNISADTLIDSSVVKSDTMSDSTKLVSGSALAESELPDSAELMLVEEIAEPEITELIEELLAESAAAAISKEVSLSISQNTGEIDEKPAINYNDAVKQFFTAENRTLRWVKANLFYLFFLLGSAIVIITALFFFGTKKDGRRFLTTTRLSVLDKMVQKGCRHIESNYMDSELTVDTVCNELVTGASYLNALFIKEIGIDVHSFIVQVRVNSIRNYLAENPSESDLGKICEQCGFKTVTEAQEHFARLCGVGIAEYRKSMGTTV